VLDLALISSFPPSAASAKKGASGIAQLTPVPHRGHFAPESSSTLLEPVSSPVTAPAPITPARQAAQTVVSVLQALCCW
jgi:hypothetical protein